MNYNRLYRLILTLAIALFSLLPLSAQRLSSRERQQLSQAMSRMIDTEVAGNSTRIQQVEVRGRRLRLYCSNGLANYPFRPESVKAFTDTVRRLLPEQLKRYQIEIYTDGKNIAELIPMAYRTSADKRGEECFTYAAQPSLRREVNPLHTPTRGLAGRHLALWQSHGRYFEQAENRWCWQRTAHWQTREDLFTQSFVVQYLVPMLEKAGAVVLLPRERDLSTLELIVDNDKGGLTSGSYTETEGREAWQSCESGFAHSKAAYLEGENPFEMGTVRRCRSVQRGAESHAVWRFTMPEAGRYTLYVSYRSETESTTEARYAIRQGEQIAEVAVNQRMGGGTWIPLGEFEFEVGEVEVTLSNHTGKSSEVVTADAIRIGGGYGNIARTPCDSLRREGVSYYPMASGLPRSMEGSRYWLQWAGFAPSVYAPYEGEDDYRDDYMSRAHWVNALMGGSERLPDAEGLGIPIDLALAFHSDSGVRDTDETIGTLGIFYTKEGDEPFTGGVSRYRSRDLTDLVMSELCEDIRTLCEPSWRRRGMWNRSYYEARVPAVPTLLLELLSHQNLADMRYGHDPRFKFIASRAIYKGILKYLASQYGERYVVQPLPIEAFTMERTGDTTLRLKWQPRHDRLEPTAAPEGYILYTALDNGPFDRGRRLEGKGCEVELSLIPGRHYHFRIAAFNDGGESFLSETLSAALLPEQRGEVLIINGFTRVSAAPSFRGEFEAGFSLDYDSGVPWGEDITYIGKQQVFERALFQEQEPEKALGACSTEYEGERVAGNRFHYPKLHGRSIARAGYSYLSTSLRAIELGSCTASSHNFIDLIWGKQRTTLLGSGSSGYDFALLPAPLREYLREALHGGISLFASGCYIASDIWEGAMSNDADRRFAREVLHYELQRGAAAQGGRLRAYLPEVAVGSFSFNQQLSPERYAVESPDALLPVGDGAFSWVCYPENSLSAGVAYAGEEYRTVLLGVPFESILHDRERDRMMQQILNFLTTTSHE